MTRRAEPINAQYLRLLVKTNLRWLGVWMRECFLRCACVYYLSLELTMIDIFFENYLFFIIIQILLYVVEYILRGSLCSKHFERVLIDMSKIFSKKGFFSYGRTLNCWFAVPIDFFYYIKLRNSRDILISIFI